MTTVQTVGAISNEAAEWLAIDWPSVYRNVRRLQVRIVKAVKENRWNKVKALQRLTVTDAERFGRVNFHSNVISTGL